MNLAAEHLDLSENPQMIPSATLACTTVGAPPDFVEALLPDLIDLRQRLQSQFGPGPSAEVLIDSVLTATADARLAALRARRILAEGTSTPQVKRAETLDRIADRAHGRIESSLLALQRLRPQKAELVIRGEAAA